MARRVVIPLFPGYQPLDVTGPHEVFAGATAALEHRGRSEPRYTLELVATTPGPVESQSALGIVAGALPEPTRAVDTLLIPGGDGARQVAAAGGELIEWIHTAAPHARRVATVCSGTFLAAAAGCATASG